MTAQANFTGRTTRHYLGDGRVTEAHLNARIAEKVSNSAERSPIPQPTEPFHIGATSSKPAPDHDMWAPEREHPWLRWLYMLAFVGMIAASCWYGCTA